MKYQTYKKCTKDYEEIFTKEKETKVLRIEINGIFIEIAEQQLGSPINPHIEIIDKDGTGYSMNLSTLIENLL